LVLIGLGVVGTFPTFFRAFSLALLSAQDPACRIRRRGRVKVGAVELAMLILDLGHLLQVGFEPLWRVVSLLRELA
jgi:hypothetical protein